MFLNLLKLPSNRTDCCWFGCLKLEATGLCWRVITDNFLPLPPDIKGHWNYIQQMLTQGSQKELGSREQQMQTCTESSFSDMFIEGNGRCTGNHFEISLSLSCASFLSPPPPLSVWGSIFSVSLSVSPSHSCPFSLWEQCLSFLIFLARRTGEENNIIGHYSVINS